MCGIAGIIGRVSEANRQALHRMARAMAHRGPDGEGFWTSPVDGAGRGCMLAHRRLAILDLTACAAQPMVDAVMGDAIVFNGEIYNFRTLRGELEAGGQSFQSSGDTAVMLRALALGGAGAVRRLRGMFAFGMWDVSAGELVLGRDPLGMKPLYVCRNSDEGEGAEWSLAFASEVRAVLASGLLGKPRLDPAAVASVVWNGFVTGPGTAVRGVELVWPGEVRVYDARGRQRSAETVWSIPRGEAHRPATLQEVGEALRESVKLHLASDVPLGVFLSGGIDSSAVANLARQASDRPVHTFTLAFEEASHDERAHARRVAEAIGTEHREVVLSEARFVESLEAAIESLDQPTFDGLNSYFISKAVREAGLTVAVAGTGGDELFGGYSSFRYVPRLARWAQRTRLLPRGAKVAAARVAARAIHPRRGAVAPQTRWAKLPEMVRAGDGLTDLYQLAYALFLPDFQRELLDGTLERGGVRWGLSPAMRDRLTAETHGRSPLATISILEQRLFLGERLLRDTDAASMAVSLETRLPLVDAPFVERVSALPDPKRYAPLGRKQALRTIGLAGLDPALFERPKSGFVLPLDHWVRRRLGGAMDAVMRDEHLAAAAGLDGGAVARLWSAYRAGAPGMYWSRVWGVYVLIRWCHRHGVVL